MSPAVRALRGAVTEPLTTARAILSPEKRRVIKFVVVGSSGVLVNLAVVAVVGPLLLQAFAGESTGAQLTFLLGILVSIFTNFMLNDQWTWRDRPKKGTSHWFQRCGEFYLAASLAATLQFIIATSIRPLLSWEFGFWIATPERISLMVPMMIGILVATPLNYVINNFWTFRDR